MRIQISEKTRKACQAIQSAKGYEGSTYRAIIEAAVLEYQERHASSPSSTPPESRRINPFGDDAGVP